MRATGTEVRDEAGVLLGWLDYRRPPEVEWSPLTIVHPHDLDFPLTGEPMEAVARTTTLRPVRCRGRAGAKTHMVWKVCNEHELECLKTPGKFTSACGRSS